MVDCWCETEIERVHFDQQQLNLNGNLLYGILGFDQDNVPVYIEKTFAFHWEKDLESDVQEWVYHPFLTVETCAYTFTGNRELELRTQLGIRGQLYGMCSLCGVSDLVLDTNVMPDSVGVSLILYYAKAGEKIFDIAKRYHMPCSEICSANGITDDVLAENKALIVPIV